MGLKTLKDSIWALSEIEASLPSISQPVQPAQEKTFSTLLNSRWAQIDRQNGLVIGIDFGTTHSGVAWATTANFEQRRINVITTWPGIDSEQSKVPTEISYDRNGGIRWGYNIPADQPRIQWFKLLLLDSRDLGPEMQSSRFLQRTRDVLRNSGKTVVQVIADYLRMLCTHVMSILVTGLGQSVVGSFPIHVVLTVPALWKGYARQKMEEAAQLSGILGPRPAGPTLLSLVSEPEAASLSTLLERWDSVKKGDVYIVCDAGSGTVDLITYAIEDAPLIRMREAVEGTGGLCGGVCIDEAFEGICRDRLGDSWKRLSRPCRDKFMRGDWESSIKPGFTACNWAETAYTAQLPREIRLQHFQSHAGDAPIDSNGRIYFNRNHISHAFGIVLSSIEGLVNAQIKKAANQRLRVTGLILVGGLGESPYIRENMTQMLAKKKIAVLQPAGLTLRTAICQGALCKGFLDNPRESAENEFVKPIEITSTVCRASFGVSFTTQFIPGKHHPDDKVWYDLEGLYGAANQLRWYLKKGDSISKTHQVSHPFYVLRERNWDGQFSVKIYQCEDDNPPSRMTDRVELLCTIDCTLEGCIPVGRLKNHYTAAGKKMKELDYTIRMVPSGRSVDFEVVVNGTPLGRQNLNVRFLTGSAGLVSATDGYDVQQDRGWGGEDVDMIL